MKNLLEAIAATAEIMGTTISPAAAVMMVKDLSDYKHDDVIAALKIVRSGSGRFNLKEIVDALAKVCPDGRPGANEAWAMMPKDEHASAVMTEEMAQALHIAQPLIDDGDQYGARMAFVEAYKRIVDAAKLEGTPVKWFASLGFDKEERTSVIADAVRLGRLKQDHAASLLPPEKAVAMLENLNPTTLQIESKPTDAGKARAQLSTIKAMLSGSKLMKAVA